MSAIGASVGLGGANAEADVLVVQRLLGAAGCDTKGVDGVWGKDTCDAIVAFQSRFMTEPDGLIEPGGRTLSLLEAARAPADPAPAAPAAATPIADWSGDSAQWSQEKKLASLEPTFRPKIGRVIARLKAEGFQPRIVFGWRSVQVQAKLRREGKTKVSFSFHNAQKRDGTPNACAVDIVDSRWAWNEPDCHKFFRALGAAGKAEGLVWGGDWKSFRDWAHLQGRQNGELAAVKRESGLA